MIMVDYGDKLRSVLICHEGVMMNRVAIARWLNSFTDLAGIVVIRDRAGRKLRRVRRELRNNGVAGFVDMALMRMYYRLFLSRRDERWLKGAVERVCSRYPELPDRVRVLHTDSPNSAETAEFIRSLSPQFMVARCKMLLKEEIFSIPEKGTFVMHPGICPEYRNSHGCFWALANGDTGRVGMTLLKIDSGVDTGPVYGYYTYDYDEARESHIVIQARTVLENLDALAEKLVEICSGRALVVDTSGRKSAMWGQPVLTRYLRWKLRAGRRRR